MDTHRLELIKEKLAAVAEEYFTVANEFALGENGLPKNGTVAVCLHEVCNASNRALKALNDSAFAERLNRRQFTEHTASMLIDRQHPGT